MQVMQPFQKILLPAKKAKKQDCHWSLSLTAGVWNDFGGENGQYETDQAIKIS